jgi:hypothetical protein
LANEAAARLISHDRDQRRYPHSGHSLRDASARSGLVHQVGEFALDFALLHLAPKNCAFRLPMSTIGAPRYEYVNEGLTVCQGRGGMRV